MYLNNEVSEQIKKIFELSSKIKNTVIIKYYSKTVLSIQICEFNNIEHTKYLYQKTFDCRKITKEELQNVIKEIKKYTEEGE